MESPIERTRRWARVARAARHVPDPYWAALVGRSILDPSRTAYARRTRSLYLNDFRIALQRPDHAFFLDALSMAWPLHHGGARFRISPEGEILCEIEGFQVAVRAFEDLAVLHEVCDLHVYGIDLPPNAVCWDIGMNIGVSSLYLAHLGASAIHAYEPFPRTHALALRNLARNPALSERIHPVNEGVAARDGALQAPYSETNKVTARTIDLAPGEAASAGSVLQRVTLRDACAVADRLRSGYPGQPLIAKIDCEGAEYEIVAALHAGDRLRHFDTLLIEWHSRGAEPLLALLRESGFRSCWITPTVPGTGMLYSMRGSGSHAS